MESPRGNLFADALREAIAGADVDQQQLERRPSGGHPRRRVDLWTAYDVFPFDNRLVRLTLTAAELRR